MGGKGDPRVIVQDHTTKWYKHKQEYVLQNEAHKILLDFFIQMDHPILDRRPDPVLTGKKKEGRKWKKTKR